MIDSVRFQTTIPQDKLLKSKWTKEKVPKGKYKGEEYYRAFMDGIWLGYYPLTKSLIISGRIINIICHNRISNFDDLFTTQEEIITFFRNFNKRLNEYFQDIKIDITKLKVTKIDYCFNLKTEYVDTYIKFFNDYFKENKDTLFSRHKNYTLEFSQDNSSSCYIKTNADFRENIKRNFVINFYNKGAQLENKKKEDIEKRKFSNIKDEDIKRGNNILRLEIQVYYNTLKAVCKKNNLPWTKRCLHYLFDVNIATYVFQSFMKRFFTTCDYYSHKRAKEVLKENGYRGSHKIYDYINGIAHHKKVKRSVTYDNKLKELGICPYCFIPTSYNIDKLENPLKLIDRKIIESSTYNLSLRRKAELYVRRV